MPGWIVKDIANDSSEPDIDNEAPTQATTASRKRKRSKPSSTEPPTTTTPPATKPERTNKRRKKATKVQKETVASPETASEAAPKFASLFDLPWSEVKGEGPNGMLLADDAPGGFFCLEELDGYDVEYEVGQGGGKVIKFKKVKDVKPKGKPAQPTAPLPEDMMGNFINVDDFTEDGVNTAAGTADADEALGGDEDRGDVADADVDMGDAQESPVSNGAGAEVATDGTDKKAKKKEKKAKAKAKKASEDVTEEADGPADDMEDATDDSVPNVDMSEWSSFDLAPVIIKGLAARQFTSPTEIQAKTLPIAFKGDHDIIGAAETGSGKTLAFGLPVLNSLATRTVTKSDPGCHALILTPTRELAMQVAEHLKLVAKFMRVKIVAIVGGMSEQKQRRLLSSRPDVVVATPGRLWELLSQDAPMIARFTKLPYLVIDEADRMLEKGHFKDLDSILNAISLRRTDDPESNGKPASASVTRRTFIFSATLIQDGRLKQMLNKPAKKNQKISDFGDLLRRLEFQDPDPVYVDVTKDEVMASHLLETRIDCLQNEKDVYLYYILTAYTGRTLVFVNSIDAIRRLVPLLTLMKVNAYGLHAEMQQRQRLKNLDRFRDQPTAVLIASDVAARGLDIPNVEHVIHYQLPRTADLYVHRSGRTARGSSEGVSVLLCSPEEASVYGKICRILKKEDGIPEFPIDRSMLSLLKQRISLARKIEESEHRFSKSAAEKNWLKKAAEEADIELDSDLDDEMGGDGDEDGGKGNERKRLDGLKRELAVLLQKQVVPKGVKKRYLTSGADGGVAGMLLESVGTHAIMPTMHQVKAVEEVRKKGKKK